MSTPTNEPTTLRAGDSLAWTRTLDSYSADDGWALQYRIIPASGSALDLTASASGTVYAASISAAQSAALAAGAATMVSWVERGSERVTLGAAPLTILENLTAATAHDNRSHARKMLDAIEAAIENRATRAELDLLSFGGQGRSLAQDPQKLLDMRAYYRREVAAENARNAVPFGGTPGRCQVRM